AYWWTSGRPNSAPSAAAANGCLAVLTSRQHARASGDRRSPQEGDIWPQRARRRDTGVMTNVSTELAGLDQAVYAAIAATDTPTLDRAMRTLAQAADHSRLSMAAAAVLALRAGGAGPAGRHRWTGRGGGHLGGRQPRDEAARASAQT